MMDLDEQLIRLTGRPDSQFRDGQREAVESLALKRERVVLVQSTGWGKSAVYFLATRLLRDAGAGPTLIVSPLLALMRNQLTAARRLGIRAESINSTNPEDHQRLRELLETDSIDVLLISPERLANPDFVNNWLPMLLHSPGLLVIDEVHCISDWGHDFRPDYRRLRHFVDSLPAGTPVLGCTATANDRVIEDVRTQLGANLVLQRGPLARAGLGLHVLEMPSQAHRLAWLAAHLPSLPGTGIVYCLTVADTRIVAEFLNGEGLDVLAYSGDDETGWKTSAEDRLLANDVKALIATSALGMGFDKPDVGFVVHYQSPGSPIAYYQQVGRAGRALDRSVAVLLRGAEDTAIQNYFLDAAFPDPARVDAVLDVLRSSPDPVSVGNIEVAVNISRGRLSALLKQLEVERAIRRVGGSWTLGAVDWVYPHERVDAVTTARRVEQAQMDHYATVEGCRMVFLRSLLDDLTPEPCGVCDRCAAPVFSRTVDQALMTKARAFVRHRPVVIEPRRQWPTGMSEVRGKIPSSEMIEPGRAAGRLEDPDLGLAVRRAAEAGEAFTDDHIAELVATFQRWNPTPRPTWVTCVPSDRPGDPVSALAAAVADAIGLPFVTAVSRVGAKSAQAEMNNSAMQTRNVLRAFTVDGVEDTRPVLLIDDSLTSRWTATVVGRLLRRAGCSLVYPLVIASGASSS
jgi:ATP-dependent DNA helicase RecQ